MRTPDPETRSVVVVDCPLCDAPIPFDPRGDTLDCAACRITVAVDPADPTVLAAAA